MLTGQHTLKSSAQKVSKSTPNNSVDKTKVKPAKTNNTSSRSPEKNEKKREDSHRIEEIYGMLKTVMAKLDTLDDIQKRIVCVEQDFKQMKTSLEFAHAEVLYLKDEVERTKKSENKIQRKMCNLEESNRLLQESVIDLKARSMRDNLLFYNIGEEERENTDENIYQILDGEITDS
jgi:hypothetical protein